MAHDLLKNSYPDQDFLNSVIALFEPLTKIMPKQMLSIKNCDSAIVFCSDYFAGLIGIKPEEILNSKFWASCYDGDMTFAKIIAEEDEAVIKGREPKIFLKINHFQTGLMPYLCIKTPIINSSTNNVVGLLIQGFEIGSINILHELLQDHTLKKEASTTNSPPHLSKREKQVIFLFLANLSSQAIADMLHQLEGKAVTKSTIDSLFNDQLYVKFNVYNRPDLYKKLKDLGFNAMIPHELLVNTSISLDMLKVY